MSERGRTLGPWSASALVIANMVGAGVFTTSGFALADLGRRDVVLAAWAVGGIVAICGALAYGGLARRFPRSGGEYTFLAQIFHPFAGFLAGWVSLLAGFTAPIAAAALGLQAYLVFAIGTTFDPRWIGSAAILASGVMHGIRLREGVRLQNIAVALKLGLLAGFLTFGLGGILAGGGPPATEPADGSVALPGLTAFFASLVWIYFAYSGWNAAVYVAGEIRDPDRHLARSLLGGTIVVTVLYLALNAVFLFSTERADLAGQPEVAAIAARALGGESLGNVVAIAVALALFTSVSSMVMAGPRVYEQMAADGVLPRVLAAGGDTPRVAVFFQVGLALAVVWWADLGELLRTIGFTLGLCAAAAVFGIFVVRAREGAERLPVPGYPFVPLVFLVSTLGSSAFLVMRSPREALVGLLVVVSGAVFYVVSRRFARPAP